MAKLLVGVNDLQTNHPGLSSQAFGWDPVDIIGPKNGSTIRTMESSILKALKSKNVDVPSKNVTKFSGYTETWLKSDYPVRSLEELISITK